MTTPPPWRDHSNTMPLATALLQAGADDATAAAHFAAAVDRLTDENRRLLETQPMPIRLPVVDAMFVVQWIKQRGQAALAAGDMTTAQRCAMLAAQVEKL